MQQAIQAMMYPADLINAALEELVRQSYTLPAFSTLNRLALRIRSQTHSDFFRRIFQQIEPGDRIQLDTLLQLSEDLRYTPFTGLKQVTGRLTRRNIDLTIQRLKRLEPFHHLMSYLTNLPSAKVGMFAAEAHALEVGDLLDMDPPKRYTLLLCFLHHAQTRLRDDLAYMLIRRMDRVRNNAQKTLDDIKKEQRAMRERFIDLFARVVHMTNHIEDDHHLGRHVRQMVADAGGADAPGKTMRP